MAVTRRSWQSLADCPDPYSKRQPRRSSAATASSGRHGRARHVEGPSRAGQLPNLGVEYSEGGQMTPYFTGSA
jgi:hypothetical protein